MQTAFHFKWIKCIGDPCLLQPFEKRWKVLTVSGVADDPFCKVPMLYHFIAMRCWPVKFPSPERGIVEGYERFQSVCSWYVNPGVGFFEDSSVRNSQLSFDAEVSKCGFTKILCHVIQFPTGLVCKDVVAASQTPFIVVTCTIIERVVCPNVLGI